MLYGPPVLVPGTDEPGESYSLLLFVLADVQQALAFVMASKPTPLLNHPALRRCAIALQWLRPRARP